MFTFPPLLFGNPIQAWLVALAATLGSFLALWLFQRVVLPRLFRFGHDHESKLDHLFLQGLKNTRVFSAFALALFIGIQTLATTPAVDRQVKTALLLVLLLHGTLWLRSIISYYTTRAIQRQAPEDKASVTTINRLAMAAKIALWLTFTLVMFSTLGYNVSGLVAGLGVGGIAVALAMQKILGDLFASLSIIMDKPFAVGDFIIVGDVKGLVQHIGLKTTRLRSVSGEEVVFSNSDLLQSRILNCRRITERKVRFTLRLALETPHATLCGIPAIIRQVIEAQQDVRFRHSYLEEIGISYLEFKSSYAIRNTDWDLFKDVQHAINLELLRRFQVEGIRMAYPTQTVHHQPFSAAE